MNELNHPIKPAEDLPEILISADRIAQRIAELGNEINRDYVGLNPLLVGVLKGVIIFMADLIRIIEIPIEVDFIAVTNYSPVSRDQGFVRLVKDLEIPIQNRHVIFVEDVVDTGMTLNYLLQNLQTRIPASMEVCTLFNKPKHRLINLPMRYIGFDLPDKFVVGYGLDFHEQYRYLPYLGVLSPTQYKSRFAYNG